MAFQDIPLEVKVKAVIDMMKGQGATEIARRYKVGRRTLYEWIEQAKEGIRESLNLEKRGPKFKKPRVDPDLRKIEKLNELLEKREIQIRELEGLLGQYQKEEKEKEPRPKECKKCGCQKIYKNGTYSAKPKRFFDILRSREQKEIIVQQFICAHCQEPVHLEKKSAFFWWASRQRA